MLTSSCWLLTGTFDWSRGDTDGSVSHAFIGQRECGEVSVKSSQCQVWVDSLYKRERPLGEGLRGDKLKGTVHPKSKIPFTCSDIHPSILC